MNEDEKLAIMKDAVTCLSNKIGFLENEHEIQAYLCATITTAASLLSKTSGGKFTTDYLKISRSLFHED